MYDRATIDWLVVEANLRGVRLIPYFEVVGHNALGEAWKDIFYCNGVAGGGLPHPLHAVTWASFDALWADMKAIFPEEYVNIGGDEFDFTCWTNDTEINDWYTAKGYPAGDWDYIIAYYYTQLFASLAKAGFKPIMFAEAFGPLNNTNVRWLGGGWGSASLRLRRRRTTTPAWQGRARRYRAFIALAPFSRFVFSPRWLSSFQPPDPPLPPCPAPPFPPNPSPRRSPSSTRALSLTAGTRALRAPSRASSRRPAPRPS